MAKRRARKAIKIEKKPSGNYVWEDFKNPPKSKVVGYRTVKQGDHVVRVAILKGRGPRGGRTVATSVGHPLSEKKSANPQVTRALKEARRKKRKG